MKIRTLVTAAALGLLSLSASAAMLVVPAAGTGPGANDSQWQSELTLHNSAPRAIEVSVTLRQGVTASAPVKITVDAKQTLSVADILKNRFGVQAGAGALEIETSDRDARGLAVTSRISNVFAGGEYGQDIPAMAPSAAMTAGDIAAIPGPSTAAGNRLTVGIYSFETTNVTWDLVHADGVVVASKQMTYAAGHHAQYGSAVESFFGVTPHDNDTVQARVVYGKALFYGSIVNATGDPTFVPAGRTRDDIVILFQGLDLDENGTVDVADANGDGTLDTPLVVYTSMFPNYSRIAAIGEFGEDVTLEVLSAPGATVALQGTSLIVAASGDVKNTSGQITIKATSGSTSSVFTIPVLFK